MAVMADPVYQRPVEHSPKRTERGVLPGPDVGFQSRHPLAIGSFQVQPRQQQCLVAVDLTVAQLMDILQDQLAV